MQIFEGNTHYDTPELRHFEETVAQYVRLYPERWSPAGIGMRVEILGCDLPGRTLLLLDYTNHFRCVIICCLWYPRLNDMPYTRINSSELSRSEWTLRKVALPRIRYA